MPNFAIFAAAAVIPLVVGFVWYNPKVFGNAWMQGAGLTEESMKGSNMLLIFGLTYICSFFIAFALNFIVIHQFGFFSSLMTPENQTSMKDPNSEISKYVADYSARFGHNFRTFKHGALHGTITGVFLASPLLGVSALFERRSFKYFAINAGYWILSLMLMGGVICQFA